MQELCTVGMQELCTGWLVLETTTITVQLRLGE